MRTDQPINFRTSHTLLNRLHYLQGKLEQRKGKRVTKTNILETILQNVLYNDTEIKKLFGIDISNPARDIININ